MIVGRLLWSMSTGRPVRIVLRDRAGVVTARVVRCETDPVREKALSKLPRGRVPASASTVVVVLEGGREIAVDSVQRVVTPQGEGGAAFTDDEG